MHKYLVVGNQRISPTAFQITLKAENPRKRFAFKAGQYAAINFYLNGRNGRPTPSRCFSIVSSPDEADSLQFAMRVIRSESEDPLVNLH
jgi:ferredoxin-NADP reductase